MLTRKEFLFTALGFLLGAAKKKNPFIITVNGTIPANQLGTTLIHEHFLVDFIGANKISFDRWNREEVIHKVLPYLLEVKALGVKSIFDCTPAYLGRDVQLLMMLAEKSGVQLITNTGYYGAVKNKYLPAWAFKESPKQIAARWIEEYKKGIDGTTVKPGFIKISVDADGPLSEIHKKIVQAAAITHLQTGLTICSHTGLASAAFEQLDILQTAGAHPSAFVWVHAQAEEDKNHFIKAAKSGAWISLDGIGWGDFDNYANSISLLKSNRLLDKVLVSHDAGWYKPEEPEGGEFKGYTNIFAELFPRLKEKGFSEKDFERLLTSNPAKAMGVRIRKL
jgi:phosphotriesterase-related protein